MLCCVAHASSEPVRGSLPEQWNVGADNCAAVSQPPLQIHVYEPQTLVLRQSPCADPEANFLYLLVGSQKALLIDTGAFVSILHDGFIRSLGLATEPTKISAQFGRGPSKQISAAKTDVQVGVFKVPLKKFGVARLPRFALQQGHTRIAGILGMDTLYICHAIIDLDGMNLFLK